MELYKSQVVCRVCGVSPRMLDYWITSALISPTSVYRGPARKRDFFLFTFEDLVRIRIVSSLRRAGVSLQRIRTAIAALRERNGSAWQAEWLATDGRNVFVAAGKSGLEAITKANDGQLVFEIIALGAARRQVEASMNATECKPFDHTTLRGRIHSARGLSRRAGGGHR